MKVTCISTLGSVTGATYYGDGSNLTGVVTSLTGAECSGMTGVVTTLTGANGSVMTGVVTSIIAGSNITLTGGPTGIVTIAASGGGVGVGTTNVTTDSLVVTGVSTLTGTLNANGGVVGDVTGSSSQVTVSDESGDTTCFPLFTTEATGNLLPKSGTNLTFNSSSGALTATSFSCSGTTITGIPS